MGQIEMTIAAVSSYLIFSALLMGWLGKGLASSKIHQFAFITIGLLIFGVLPQLRLLMPAPGIVLSLGLMLFALHQSAYYSGTPKISVRVYSIIMLLCALAQGVLIHPVFESLSLGRFAIGGGVWLLLLELEHLSSGKAYQHSRVELSFLWLWFLSSSLSLMEPQIQRLPDLFFLVLLLSHLEKRWRGHSIPAPLVTLYGILFVWFAHFLVSLMPVNQTATTMQIFFILGLIMGFLSQSYRTSSLTKRYLYLFMAQETLILGFNFDNLFMPHQEYALLLRILLFVSLNGLFVMIESDEDLGLDAKLFEGLFFERPRITLAVLVVASILAIYPLVYFSLVYTLANLLILILVAIGLAWTFALIRFSRRKTDRKYRILRPSLSIWATVVFTILWASVAFIERLSRSLFN